MRTKRIHKIHWVHNTVSSYAMKEFPLTCLLASISSLQLVSGFISWLSIELFCSLQPPYAGRARSLINSGLIWRAFRVIKIYFQSNQSSLERLHWNLYYSRCNLLKEYIHSQSTEPGNPTVNVVHSINCSNNIVLFQRGISFEEKVIGLIFATNRLF